MLFLIFILDFCFSSIRKSCHLCPLSPHNHGMITETYAGVNNLMNKKRKHHVKYVCSFRNKRYRSVTLERDNSRNFSSSYFNVAFVHSSSNNWCGICITWSTEFRRIRWYCNSNQALRERDGCRGTRKHDHANFRIILRWYLNILLSFVLLEIAQNPTPQPSL